MRYTLVVMQMNGDLTNHQRRTDVEVQRQEANRRLVLGLSLMLDEYVPVAPEQVARFRVALDEAGRFEVDWQQPDQVSAQCTFYLEGKPRVTWLFFSGYDTLRDAAAVRATEDTLAGWCGIRGMQRGAGLGDIRDRPLLVCIPWPPTLEGLEQKRMTVYAVCLAVAFFRRAAAAGGDPSQN
jgi:hypothetical protein